MRACWYESHGDAATVLVTGEMASPEPAAGEVRVQITFSGVNPGDTKKRLGWQGAPMPFPRVIPHSDGAGVIDAVGAGVPETRLGERVWVWGAQSYRAGGTAAEFTVVPSSQALAVPDSVTDETAACLGIPGITAHRAVFADGSVAGQTILIHGVLGAVSSLAAQLATAHGARVIGSVRTAVDLSQVNDAFVGHAVALDGDDVVSRVRSLAPDGVDRVIDVNFSQNIDLDAAVTRNGGIIAAFATSEPRPAIPFWPMLFDNLVIRLLGSDDFPAEAKNEAARELTQISPRLVIPIGVALPLERTAEAHDRVDAGTRQRVIIDVRA